MSSLGPNGEEVPDGFRKRKRRGKNWLAKAIKNGSVRDPNAPDPDAGKDYAGAVVVSPPLATMKQDKE
jgi:hypothetical protein